jgi:hypothetical protein
MVIKLREKKSVEKKEGICAMRKKYSRQFNKIT